MTRKATEVGNVRYYQRKKISLSGAGVLGVDEGSTGKHRKVH